MCTHKFKWGDVQDRGRVSGGGYGYSVVYMRFTEVGRSMGGREGVRDAIREGEG